MAQDEAGVSKGALDALLFLCAVAVTAGIAGFFGYIGWDCGRTLMVWLLTNFGR